MNTSAHSPRIAPQPLPLPPELAERMARLLPAGTPPPQIFLTVARHAELFKEMVDSGFLGPTGLADRRRLPPLLREALILRTCAATRCGYEFNLHEQTISRRMGLNSAQIDDLRRPAPDPTLWTPALLAALRLVDGLVARIDVDDATWAALREHFDEPTLIEMTQIVGHYTGVAMLAALARPAWDQYR
ncbi:carboxymuconolactone decarboxylase family protein [Roseateles saccharophilus]|uniref:Alkylhydroperoxidase family enzyme n=1 Tax=Roseateles saccharophilus TaxID=304 RepID=A0A4R3VBS3_ROSSA|nr:carboxymuconolactone decarboxylase family protein [Roseateles saccharophilus]MDG0831599.1 carboxymuconolactone decarboxylase family protein [Roseateles saccharophilus]TCV00989.1 alkylhydroperoxidase family enzyme [Roseateles saccharophilus]